MNKNSLKKNLKNWTKQPSKQIQQISTKFSKMDPGKKKIIIIAGVNAAILVTTVAVGLGVGLSLDSSASALDDVQFGDPINKKLRKGKDLLTNGIRYNDETYSVVEENGKLYSVIPKGTKLDTKPPVMDGINGNVLWNRTFTRFDHPFISPYIIASGKDYFFTFNYAGINYVRILNDGNIWGGYKYNENSDKMVLETPLSDTGPLKFGTISENGLALIDLAVVYEYQLALVEYNEADSDNNRARAAARMRNADSEEGKEVRDSRKLTFKIYNYDNKANISFKQNARNIDEIPFNPVTTGTNKLDQIQIPVDKGADSTPVVTNGLFEITDLKCGNNSLYHGFKLNLFVQDNGDDICIVPTINEDGKAEVNQIVEVPIGLMNYKINNFLKGSIDHPLLNTLISPNGIVSLPGMDPIKIPEGSHFVILPKDIKVELSRDIVLNLGTYGTVAELKSLEYSNEELLISVKEEWLDYFQRTANLDEVKKLAASLGVTIKFKIKRVQNDLLDVSSNNQGTKLYLPEVYFEPVTYANDTFETEYDEFLNSFKYDLKDELADQNKFTDQWSDDLIGPWWDQNTVKSKFYPFFEETQFIAYNTEYLPSGLDFDAEPDLYNYLLHADVGDLDAISITQTSINFNQKTKLLAARDIRTNSLFWATNYYNELQKDQDKDYQQDILWKNKNGYREYYYIFKDVTVKDDPGFQSWVDHYKHGNADLRGSSSVEYTKKALFNGHIGAIIVDSNWINDEWKAGKYRTTGTDKEKEEFVKQNIRYQALPSSTWALGRRWYASFHRSLNDKKQELAEKFISKLIDLTRIIDFNNNLLNKTPIKDIAYDDIEDPIIQNQVMAKANTKTVAIFSEVTDAHLSAIWNSGIKSIASNSTYQSVIDDYIAKLSSSWWANGGLLTPHK